MPNNTQLIFFILVALLAGGVGFLGYYFLDLRKRFFAVFPGAGKKKELAADVAERLADAEQTIRELKERTKILENLAKISVQKIGFKRFNPFSDTGGDNSFVLALLDYEDNGIMISSLYTREGVRIYGKKIDKGQPRQPLSKEEESVLKEALG
jgi:hypothetical protein